MDEGFVDLQTYLWSGPEQATCRRKEKTRKRKDQMIKSLAFAAYLLANPAVHGVVLVTNIPIQINREAWDFEGKLHGDKLFLLC